MSSLRKRNEAKANFRNVKCITAIELTISILTFAQFVIQTHLEKQNTSSNEGI